MAGEHVTLALSYVDRPHVLQVTDRLVSRKYTYSSGRVEYKPYEPLANKTLIYVAADAVVVISYAGASYIRGLNTDNWIAEVLVPSVGRAPKFALQSGDTNRRVTIGFAVQRLAEALDRDFATMSAAKRAAGIAIQIVGFQWRQRRPMPRGEMPIVWHLGNTGKDSERTIIDRKPRYWGWEKRECAIQCIGYREKDPARLLDEWARDRARAAVGTEVDDIEAAMVDIVRHASDFSHGTIGRECISVLLSLTPDGTRVRYFTELAEPAAFTPWVLIPGAGILAPSLSWGNLPTRLEGPLPFRFERIGPLASSDLQALRSWERRAAVPDLLRGLQHRDRCRGSSRPPGKTSHRPRTPHQTDRRRRPTRGRLLSPNRSPPGSRCPARLR